LYAIAFILMKAGGKPPLISIPVIGLYSFESSVGSAGLGGGVFV
jgi:hypothetical protein